MLQSFDYIADSESRILIVGTMPGEASLSAGQYYAHPRNVFWNIIADVFNNGRELTDYDVKRDCLLTHGVGLWDSLKYCERPGSLDSNIRNESPNDFNGLLQMYPQIRVLLFNGQKAFSFFKKYHAPLLQTINYQVLPSTSPANARLNYQQKLELWRQALK